MGSGQDTTVLVTGGAGFIGSFLIDRLLEGGATVVCVDNLSLGRMENIAHHLDDPKFTFIKQDLLDLARMQEIFAKHRFDCVYHLAANSDIKQSTLHTDIDFKLNFLTTYHVLECMRAHGVKRIVFSSTSAIYGKADGAISETYGPIFPISLYGASKLAAEAYISVYVDNFGLQAWIVRFPNVVGERATHGAIFDFINKLTKDPNELEVLGNGKQRKPYIYVRELVDAILFVREHAHDRLNVYNISPETDTSVSEIAQAVIGGMGLDARIRYTGGAIGWVGDVPFYKYDTAKLRKLGWRSELTSNEAVAVAVRRQLGHQ